MDRRGVAIRAEPVSCGLACTEREVEDEHGESDLERGGACGERSDGRVGLPLEVNGERNADAAWYYREPKPAAKEIKDHVAFWKGVRVEA
jgi:hypothetical protein